MSPTPSQPNFSRRATPRGRALRSVVSSLFLSAIVSSHAAQAALPTVALPQAVYTDQANQSWSFAYHADDPGQAAEVTLDVFRYDDDGRPGDKPVMSRRFPVRGLPDARFSLPIPQQRGLYKLTFSVLPPLGSMIEQTELSLAVIPAGIPAVPTVGVITHFGQGKGDLKTNLTLVKMAGISRIRDELYWPAIEKKPGVFSFPRNYDAMISTAHQYGITPLIVLDYGNQTAYPKLFPKGERQLIGPVARRLYAQYAYAVAKHYGNTLDDYEIWNEPTPQDFGDPDWHGYVDAAKQATQQLRRANPHAFVLACGGGGIGGGPGGACIAPMLQQGLGQYVDGFSVHPYMAPNGPDHGYKVPDGPLPTVNIAQVWPYLNRMVTQPAEKPARPLTVWATEIGWFSSGEKHPASDQLQAAYVSRLLLLSRQYNAKQVNFLYDFQDDGTNKGSTEDNFGLIHVDTTPKLSYVALAVTNATTAGTTYEKTLAENPQGRAVLFGGTRTVIAAYSFDEDHDMDIPVDNGSYLLRDWQGGDRPVQVTDGHIKLSLHILPQYLIKQ